MAAAATKCCPLSDEQKFVCVEDMEDMAKLIFGALCRRHEAEPINDGVGHCCDDSYAFRKPCFDDLHVDRTYISPPLSCDQVISLTEESCKAEEEFQTESRTSNSPGMLSWHGFCETGNSLALQVLLSPAQLQTGSLEVTKLLYVQL
ncbi:alpha-fetoprotein-like [Rousettus aegyptiacus]|uniref:alpha-fetoprotein-like n=1 Tax=Rousettus aegyptiacus TaxID=9407 RepID=UPI00168D2189|nr:alpha-fetoprotein-like [Rousettus aegyptiacus]